MLDAVILDVGGVLLIPHADVVSDALRQFDVNIDEALAERAHFLSIAALDGADSDATGFTAYRDAYARAIGVPKDTHAQALECMAELWAGPNIDLWRQPVSGSTDGLRRLATRSVKLAIVSNSDGTVEEQLRRHQICQVGEGLGVPVLAIIDSHVAQVAKPAAAIFIRALEHIGVPPQRAAYVGDTVRYDVAGARAAGLLPIHFDPFELCPQREDHRHIRQLVDLELLLES